MLYRVIHCTCAVDALWPQTSIGCAGRCGRVQLLFSCKKGMQSESAAILLYMHGLVHDLG